MLLNENVKKQLKNELFHYINKKCIFRCDPSVHYFENEQPGVITSKNPFENTSSRFFLRRLTHNPTVLTCASALITDLIFSNISNENEVENFQLCTLETSGIPLMTGIQMYIFSKYTIPINAFTVRKERKKEGLYNIIDGLPNENNFIFVDDLINSGTAAKQVCFTCEKELSLLAGKNIYSIVSSGNVSNAQSIFHKNDFDFKFDKDNYWLPEDCNVTYNKYPEYR